MSEKKLSARKRAYRACQEILESGSFPRFQEVKERIKGGSPNDIKRGIDEWTSEHIAFVLSHLGRPGIPDWAFESTKKIFDAAVEHVEREYASKRLELEQAQEKAAAQVESARLELHQAHEQVEALEARIADMEAEKAETDKAHNKAITELQEQLKQAGLEKENLDNEYALCQSELESAKSTIATQEKEFQEKLAQEMARNQSEEDRLNALFDQERTDRKAAQEELAELRETLRRRVEEDSKKIADLSVDLKQKQVELSAESRRSKDFKSQIDKLLKKLSRSETQISDLQARLDIAREKEGGNIREIAMLRETRDDLEEQVAKLLDRLAEQNKQRNES